MNNPVFGSIVCSVDHASLRKLVNRTSLVHKFS